MHEVDLKHVNSSYKYSTFNTINLLLVSSSESITGEYCVLISEGYCKLYAVSEGKQTEFSLEKSKEVGHGAVYPRE